MMKLIEPIETNICLSIVEKKKEATEESEKESISCSLSVIVVSEQIMLNLCQKQVEIWKHFADTLVQCFARKTARIPR
jgi:hypothetical protein